MGIALSGGINIWGRFRGDTKINFIQGLTTHLLQAGWVMDEAVAASKSFPNVIVTSGSDGQGFSAGGINYTWKNVINNAIPNEVLIDADPAVTLQHAVAAVNGASGGGTNYSNSTTTNPTVIAASAGTTLILSAKVAGPAGNGISTSGGVLVGGGFRVRGESPQPQATMGGNLATKAYVHSLEQTDQFGNIYAHTQIISDTDASVKSPVKVATVTDREYQVVANRCQFFCFVPGQDRPTFGFNDVGSMIAAGVQWVQPGDCADETPFTPTNDTFWVNGDGGNSLSLRNQGPGRVTGGTGLWNQADGQYNGQLTTGTTSNVTGNFRLMTMTPSDDYLNNQAFGRQPNRPWLVGERTMLLEPMVGWGAVGVTGPPYMYGQLWDAWWGTKQYPLDTVKKFSDGRWYLAFSSTNLGTLWLLVPNPTPVDAASYQASYAF